MGSAEIQQKLKYQDELDTGFGKIVASMTGGENLYRCIQCGTCSSTCPLSLYMDYTPRRIIAMTRAGFKDEVLSSNTIWLCASCYACTVDCPRQIRITDVMFALKRLAIEKTVYPKRFPIAVLAREFYKSVMSTGRSNEARTVGLMFLKAAPLKLLRQAALGLRLLVRGRLPVRKASMNGRSKQVRMLLEYVDEARRGTGDETGEGLP